MPVDYRERDRIGRDEEEIGEGVPREESQSTRRFGVAPLGRIVPGDEYQSRDRITDDKLYQEAMQKANFDRLAREEVADKSLPGMLFDQVASGQNQMVEGPVARATDLLGITEGKADTLNRLQGSRNQAATERYSEIPYINERVTQAAVGTATQLPMIVAGGAIGGTPGVIGMFAANVANESYTQARDAGLSETDARDYALKMGAIEGGVTAAFSMVGLGGVEKMAGGMFSGAVKQGVGRAVRNKLMNFAVKDLTPEFVEEVSIEALQNAITASSNVDPNAADFDRQLDSMIDVALQTAMMTVAMKGVHSATNRLTRPGNAAGTPENLTAEDLAQIEAERRVAEDRMQAEAAKQNQDGTAQPEDVLTYEQFSQQYRDFVGELDRYADDPEGARHYEEALQKMEDLHPDWVQRIESEAVAGEGPTNAQPGVPGVTPGVQDGVQDGVPTDGSNQREGVILNEDGNEIVVRDEGREEEGNEGQVGSPAGPTLPPTATPPGSDPNAPGGAAADPLDTLSNDGASSDIVSLGEPGTIRPDEIAETVGAMGSGIVDGMYRKIWDDAQSGRLAQMDKPPLFEQMVLLGQSRGVVRSLEDVRLLAEGWTGDFETDKAVGIGNLNRLSQKYMFEDESPATETETETTPEPTTQPEAGTRRFGQDRFDPEDQAMADAALDEVLGDTGLPAKPDETQTDSSLAGESQTDQQAPEADESYPLPEYVHNEAEADMVRKRLAAGRSVPSDTYEFYQDYLRGKKSAEQADARRLGQPKEETKPARRKVYQGRGATPEQVYGERAVQQGRAVPLLGKGQYYTFDAKEAEAYGDVTELDEPEAKNTLVLSDDKQWRELLAEAKAPHLDNMSREFYEEPSKIPEATERLQKLIRDKGFDSVRVELPEGKQNKRLREMFGHEQLVMFEDVINPTESRRLGQEKSSDTLSPEQRELLANEIERRVEAGDFRQDDIDALRPVVQQIQQETTDAVTAWHEKHGIPRDKAHTRPGYLSRMVQAAPYEGLVDLLQDRFDRYTNGHKNVSKDLVQRTFRLILDDMGFQAKDYTPIQDPQTPGTTEKFDDQKRRVTNVETTADGFEVGLAYTKGLAINERSEQPDGTVTMTETGRRGAVPNYWVARKGRIIEIGDTREEALDKARGQESRTEKTLDEVRNRKYTRKELQEIADAKGRGWYLRMIAKERGIEKSDTRRFEPLIREILEQQAEAGAPASDTMSPTATPRFSAADQALADAALNEVLGIASETGLTKPDTGLAKPKRLGGKAKSGQITMFPGVERDIDRQDAVSRVRIQFLNGMEQYHGNDGLTDEQATAIKESFPVVGKILDRIYRDEKIKDYDDYYGSDQSNQDHVDLFDILYERGDVSHSRIEDDLFKAVEAIIASRPKPKKKRLGGEKPAEVQPEPAGDNLSQTEGEPEAKPKTKLQQAAEAQDDKFKAAGNKLLDAIRKNQTKATIGLDAEIMKLSVEFAVEGVKKGALDFAVFVESAYNTFGESIDELMPYLELGWDALHRRNFVKEPAGNAQEIVDRLRNANPTTEQNDGRQVLTDGDTADQAGSDGRGRDEEQSGRPDVTGTLEGAQSADVRSPENPGDTIGVRDSDAGSLQQEGDGSIEQLGDGDLGGGTDVRGDAASGTRGTGTDGGRSDGSGAVDGQGDSVAAGVSDPATGMNLAPRSTRPNFHLTNPEVIIGKGLKDKFKRNQRALELAEDLEESGRPPTQEELETLASYIGWGAFGQELFQGTWDSPRVKKEWTAENEWLREYLGEDEWRSAKDSIINAHYTDPEVVTGIWSMLRRMGFKGGRMLEPSFGVGNFAALMPRDIMAKTNITAIELDQATARIAKILYPQINVQQKGYQQSQTPDDFYDVEATNVPFADVHIADKRYRQKYALHNYFFRRGIDQLKPGGIKAFITSNMTMDGKEQAKLLRQQLSDRADLIGAYRFPTGAFERYAKTKVVADLIILRKRKPGEAPSPLNEQWLDIVEYKTPSGETIEVNKYWTLHPENIMGTMDYGNGTTSGRPGMIVHKPDDLAERWQRIVDSVPENILNTDRSANEGKERPNEKKLRQNTVLAQGGEIYVAKGEQLLPLKEYVNWYRAGSKPKTIEPMRKQLEALLGVRNVLEQVLEVQGKGEDATKERAELNRVYDDFVRQYGYISETKAIGYLMAAGDAIAHAVKSLETKLPDGTYDKRAVFTKTTVRQAPRIGEKLDTIDAFALARNNSVDIDWDEVAKMAQKPKAEVLAELEAQSMIYKIGDDLYDAADVFLSGNMARKLRQLEAAKQEGVEGLDKAIEAVKKVMPQPLTYNQIQVSLGAPWVSAEDYSQFVADLLDSTPDQTALTRGARGWRADFGAGVNSLPGVVTHGHQDVPFSRLVAAALNNGRVKVYFRDLQGNQQFDETATANANAKIDELKDKFKDWIWQSPDRIERLSRVYNEDFRSTVIPDYREMNVPLRFEGLALQRGTDPFSLRKHQEAAVWRGIVSGKGLFAHEVGTGKTLTMGALAIESRRLRLANKPVLLAHNANSSAVYREIQEAYPGAKILYVDNLDPKRKQETMASIATEDWDLIVVPHSLSEKFKMRPETLERLLKEQMDELEAAALEAYNEDDSTFKGTMPSDLNNISKEEMKKLRSRTAKELVKERMKLRERIMEAYNAADSESTIFVEDMGIDMVMVDEAHIFKKLPIATRQQVKGLNKAASQPGSMLMLLADYVRGTQSGRGVYLFTGTPVTNTLNEIYNMQRFIMPDEMQAVGVKDWDGWFNTFATSELSDELSAGGTYEAFERLTSFVNLPELREMIGQYMDTVFADEMPEFIPRETRDGRIEEGESPVGRPYKEVHNETLPMSDLQKSVSKDLADRYRRLLAAKGRAKMEMMRQREYMPLVISNEGVKMALDPRLIDGVDPASVDPRDPNLKINRMITNAMAHYYEHDKSSQMIFMQLGHSDWTDRVTGRDNDGKPIYTRVRVFNLGKEIKRRLIEEGVPESEIAMFSDLSKEKRAEAAQAMNRGEIRFAIGGTETIGTGVNAQENLRSMHHLDAPWMPGELEQRNGRGQRQGNRWNTVHEYRYLTESPQDGRRWQVLLTKDRFIKRFIRSKGDERVIDMSDVDLDDSGGGDMESTFSAAVGDPRIQQRFKLEREIAKLEQSRDRHFRTIEGTLRRARQMREALPDQRDALQALQEDQQAYQSTRPADGAKPTMTMSEQGGKEKASEAKTIEGNDAIDDALKQLSERYRASSFKTTKKVAEYRGVDIKVMSGGNLVLGNWQIGIKDSFASLEGTLRNLGKRIDNKQAEIAKAEGFIKQANDSAGLPFVRQPQLDAKRKKLAALRAEMEANPEGSPAWFRNAAPIGSAFFLNSRKRAEGRQAFADMEDELQREAITREPSTQNAWKEMEEHAVSGYRSDTHVFYEKGDETIAVPADEVFDEDGNPVFKHADETRNAHDAGQAPPATSAFVTKLGNAIKKRLGGRRGGSGDNVSQNDVGGGDGTQSGGGRAGDSGNVATQEASQETTPGEPLRQADVVSTWKRLFNVPIRQGGFRWRMKGGRVKQGIYNWLTEVIRMREGEAYDLITASHEIGHHIDKMLNLYGRNAKDSRLRELFRTDKKRYYKVFGQLQALDYDPAAKRIDEGIAEAVRYIITGTSEQDSSVAPDAIGWVREQINNDAPFRDAMSQAIKHAQKYASQGALQRARSVFGGAPVDLDKRERLKHRILSFAEQQYVDYVDRLYVIKKFSDDIAGKGKIAKGEASLYEMATAFDGTIAARVARSVTDGVYSVMTNQRMGPSLQEATEHIKDASDLTDAMTYAVAVHGLEQPAGYNFGMNREDAQDFIDWVREDQEKTDRYDKFHKTLTEYNNALLLMVAETGRITPVEAARMLNAHGETYVPLLREMDDQRMKRRLGRSSENLVELPKAFQRRTAQGSGRPVKNLIESSIERAMHLTSQALRQELHNAMVAQADPQAIGPDGKPGAQGLGGWIDRIPPGSTQHATDVEGILSQLVERGFFSPEQAYAFRRASELRMGVMPSDRAVVNLREYYGLDEGLSESEARDAVETMLLEEPEISDVVTFYTPDYRRPNGKYVIKIMRGGEPQLYEVDPQLYEATMMQPDESRNVFTKIIDYFNRNFKAGAVGLNTAFLVGNLLADAQTFAVNSKYTSGKDRATKALEWTAMYVGAVANGKPNEIVELFREQGGELYNMIGVDSRRLPSTIQRMLQETTKDRIAKADTKMKPIEAMKAISRGIEEVADYVRTFNAMSDAGPRLAEMEGVFREHGYEMREGKMFKTHEMQDGKWVQLEKGRFETPPRDIVIKAMFAAGDVTYNYRRRGAKTKGIERLIPFSNAAIQSVDKTIRTYREAIKGLGSSDADQRKWSMHTAIAFAGLSALYLAAKFIRLDDEEEQDEWLRAGYAQIGLPGGDILRARMSREHSWLANIMIAGLRQISGDGDAMRRSLMHEATGRIPMPSGAGAFGVVAEQAMNYQTFFDSNIEPDYIEGVPRDSLSPKYRYDERTLWSSKAMGSVTGISPMRIEHFGSGLTGGIYTRASGAIERLLTGELSAKDIPFVRGVYYDNTRQSVSKDRFYDEMAKADREVNDQLKVSKGKHDEGTISALTQRQMMAETAQTMKLLRDHRGDEYESTNNEIAMARAAIGMGQHANYPDPYRTEVPPEVKAALTKKAVNDLGEIARGLGRPRQKTGQEADDYAQEMAVWEAKRAGTMQYYRDRMDSPIVESAISQVQSTKAFRDLLMGKGAPTPKSQNYSEEARRFGQRRQEALQFQRMGVTNDGE